MWFYNAKVRKNFKPRKKKHPYSRKILHLIIWLIENK